jgi:2-polyprenyl-6-methoxyphenol hydroxylase-like FAD-dependent oxidoreductase
MKSTEPPTTQVPIVGAGPTGLILACELARRKIKIRILERSSTFQVGSRAKGLQPRSLEILNDLGLMEELLLEGSTEVRFRRFNGNELLGDVKPEIFVRNDTRYSSGILLPQWKVEEILRKKLATFGVEVQLAKQLTGFSQEKDSVLATMQTPAGKESKFSLTTEFIDDAVKRIAAALKIR